MYNIYTYTELLVPFSAQQKWLLSSKHSPLHSNKEVTDKKDMVVFDC